VRSPARSLLDSRNNGIPPLNTMNIDGSGAKANNIVFVHGLFADGS
jgi:hypothetical protein